MRWRGKLFKLIINSSDGFDISIFDELQVCFLIFGSSFLNFLLEESIMVLSLVLVKFDETLRNETPIREGTSYLQ